MLASSAAGLVKEQRTPPRLLELNLLTTLPRFLLARVCIGMPTSVSVSRTTSGQINNSDSTITFDFFADL